MIRFDNVSKRYATGQDALKNLNFHLPKGEMAFLTGHSGAGKSTLLKLVTAIETSTRGQVFVNGLNLNTLKKSRVPYLRRNIGIIFQNHNLLFDRNVFANVALPLTISGYSDKEIKRRVQAALDKVNLLHKEKMMPLELSGGEQQRVGIARAIANRPMLLLADEPTGNLDPALSKEIMQLFDLFNQVGVSIMIASHDLDLIRSMRKPVLQLKQGQLAYNGLETKAEATQ